MEASQRQAQAAEDGGRAGRSVQDYQVHRRLNSVCVLAAFKLHRPVRIHEQKSDLAELRNRGQAQGPDQGGAYKVRDRPP